MALPIFNTLALKDFQREAKDRWGHTSAYQAFEEKEQAISNQAISETIYE